MTETTLFDYHPPYLDDGKSSKVIYQRRGSFIKEIPELVSSNISFTNNVSFIKNENAQLKLKIAILEEQLRQEKSKIKYCCFKS